MQLPLLFIQQITGLFKVCSASNSRLNKYGLDKIKYPVLPNEIPGLENKRHYTINLFYFDYVCGYNRYAQYILKRFYSVKINILWDGRYACIKHFLRLFGDTTKYFIFIIWLVIFLKFNSDYYFSRMEKKHYFTRCLKHFNEQRTLQQHQLYCKMRLSLGI